MIIQELIAAKVAQMTSNGDTFSFLHSNKDWQNLETDEEILPAVHLDAPAKGKPVPVMGGAVEDRQICSVMFMYDSNLDDNPDQQYSTLKLCHSAMHNFIQLVLQDSDNFDTTKTVWGEYAQIEAYPLFDRCVDVIILSFTCVPRNRPNVCIPSYSIPIGDCDPATVENLSGAFSQLIASGDTFTLQSNDYSFANSEGTMIINGSAEAQTDIVGVLPDIDFTDSTGITTQEPSGKNLICTPSPPKGASAMPFKTGQITSYATGDDGDVQRGRPRKTLPILEGVQQLNYFGSKWAWTGLTGGYYDYDTSQFKDVNGTVTTRDLAFPNHVIVDFRTESGNGDLMMFSLSSSWIGVGSLDFTTAQIYADALTVASFNDWFVLNINELKDTFWSVDASVLPPLSNTYPNTISPWVFASNTTDTTNSSQIFTFWIAGVNYGTELLYPKTATNPVVAYIFGRIGNTSELP